MSAPSVPTTIHVLRGEAQHELHRAAAGSGLLVLGSTRDRSWQHLPFATRSTRIAEHAPVPTAVVPSDWLPCSGPVVAAVPTVGGDLVVDRAAAEAAAAGRPLLLLRTDVLPWLTDVPSFPASEIALLDDFGRRLLQAAADRVRSAYPELEVRTELDHRGVVHELVSHGEQADLLVLGAASGSRPASPLRAVLAQAPCAVIVVPIEPGGRA